MEESFNYILIAATLQLLYIISLAWARCFRDGTYHSAINTNNGVEAQNKALKYNISQGEGQLHFLELLLS